MKTNWLPILLSAVMATAMAAPCRADGIESARQGEAAEKDGNRNAALEAYTDAIQSGDLSARQLAYVYFRRGSLKGFLGDCGSAIDDFSKAIELDPKFGAAYSLRGYLRGVVGQYDLAEKDHLAAIELADEATWEDYRPWVLQHYADLWRRRGQFDKALAQCEAALAAREYPVVYFRRAWIYLDMRKKDQAKAEFATFEREMERQQHSYDSLWPDERGAVGRLQELP